MDNSKNLWEQYATPLAVLIGAAIIAAAFIFGSGGTGVKQQETAKVDIKDVKTDGAIFIGDPNAPVTMAFWFDYQCPFCKQFEEVVAKQLYTDYVQTGKLKILIKDFQFLGQDSQVMAEFAHAMWEAYPDKFYVWYQAMFAAQDEEGDQGFGDLDSIKAETAKIEGVDVDRVVALMNQKKAQYDAAIAADRAEGQKFGISGTPAYIIGTTALSGVHPYADVAALIDAELNK